jgi:hypothetical protein
MSRARWALPMLATISLLGIASPSRAASLSFQPQLGLPGSVSMFGASPGQAAGEVWGTAAIGSVPASVNGQQVKEATVLLRHTPGSGWQIVPVIDELGNALSFTGTPAVSYGGGVAMLSADAPPTQTILTRDPSASAFVRAPAPKLAPEPGAVLETGETLSTTLAVLDEPTHTGALVVPSKPSATDPGVLHYDGTQWTREPICAKYTVGELEPCTPATKLSIDAIAASSPQNAWLLASGSGELKLFERTIVAGSGPPVWVQSQPASWAPSGDSVSARTSGQMLTVTSQGVWVDAVLHVPAMPKADLSLLLDASSPSTVLGTWCYPQAACGQGTLGAPLPEEYASFAWPSASGLGTRIITGLAGGALLRFQGGSEFQYITGGGGNASPDAAFASPEEGWVAGGGRDGAQLERVTASPESPALGRQQAWPLPFRRPLLAIAPQPGSTPGDPNAQALAVGDQGQIARYVPGEGWTPEFLYNVAGVVQTPRLRGVAWPEPGRAYAVGDEGAMWLWRADTGLWEPDPAEPLGFHGNLMGIAFSPLNPAIGYAVGKQGVLLGYNKTWAQQALPPGLEQADFTSVAFAGAEALATYRMVDSSGQEVGGLLVNKEEGAGWEVDPSAQKLLGELPNPTASVLSKVAGLPDGGAVAAGPGVVIERDSAGSGWRFSHQPLPEAQNIAALAAIRAGAEVQALVSIDVDPLSNPNNEQRFILEIDTIPPPVLGQPGGLVGPDPLPVTGYLMRETSEGWQDLEQQAYPSVLSPLDTVDSDLPDWPDAVLALDVNPSGSEGWAVGGQTSGIVETSKRTGSLFGTQTAAALRLGAGPPPPQGTGAPVATPEKEATFAVGGNAQCAGPCADLLDEGLGPDAWLSGAISSAARIPGVQGYGFLYTGARVAEGVGRSLSAEEFTREMQSYAGDLSNAGGLPVHVAASPSDIDPAGGLSTFTSALGVDAPAGSVPSGTPSPPPGVAAYAFNSEGAAGTVRVIVLDYSASALAPGELPWLAEQLEAAKQASVPAVVMGNADIVKPNAGNHAADAAAVEQVLLAYGASAYLFDSPEENLSMQIGSGTNAIPAFGTGTLGYVPPPVRPEEFLGASGFLLVSVNVAQRNPSTNRAPVTAKLTPNISQLALDATDGTLLRRSQVALFQALARRPAGGVEQLGVGSAAELAPDPYVPIPEQCNGANCASFIEPEYTFSSSNREVGEFVEPEPNSLNPRTVLQGPGGRPIPDSHSGVFCAFNSGTTTVSITTGGLTYSEPVTVQAGSVEQPCGTVPLSNPPARATSAAVPVAALPPSAPPASSPTPLNVVTPPPPPLPAPASLPATLPPRPAQPPPPFFALPPPPVSLVAVPLLPPPVLARPIPPSGTAPVTVVSPVGVAEEQSEDEEAVESARNSMAAYDPEEKTLPPLSLVALIAIAAGAGTGIRRTRAGRRARRAPALARARARHYDWLR